MDLSPEERKFIKSYEQEVERRASTRPSKEKRKIDLSRLYYAWIGFLVLAPIVTSGLFLFAMARFNSLVNDYGIKDITKNLTQEEIDTISQGSGLNDVLSYLELYNSRYQIVGIIFTVAIVLIAISVVARLTLITLPNREKSNDEER